MSVNLATYMGGPDGMVRSVAQHEIDDTALWLLVDAWLTDPGVIERRGGLDTPAAYVSDAYAEGLAGTVAPDSTWVGVQLVRKTTGPAGAIVGFRNSSIDQAWPYAPNISPHELFDSKDALNGGALIGTASGLGRNPSHSALAYWRGAAKADVSSASLSGSVARGATTVALSSGGSSFSPGMFVTTSAGVLMGVVKSISGNTLTLEDKSLSAASTSVKGYTWRGLTPRVSKGRITCAAPETTVNGGLTAFRKLGMGTGTWDIFTTDFTYVGTVASVTSDAQLELTAPPAVDLLNADYIAIKVAAIASISSPAMGWINASYAQHQFYADGNIVSYSDDDDPEALDLVDDNFTFSADNVSGLCGSNTGLVVLTERESYIVAGAVGTTPDRWTGDRLGGDGCLNPMTVQSYKGGVIWAGLRGIYYYNGSEPINIAAALGDVYKDIISNVNPASYRFWSAVVNDHYLLHVESTSSNEVVTFDEGSVSTVTNPDDTQDGVAFYRPTIAINLKTGAISFLRNVGIKGTIIPPTSDGSLGYFSLTGIQTGTTKEAVVFEHLTLFPAEGANYDPDTYLDVLESDSNKVYPQFALETKKYDVGTPQILKLFKLFLLHFLLGGTADNTQAMMDADPPTADHLRFATVKGMGHTGGAVARKRLFVEVNDDSGDGTWRDKRVKFMKRSQFLSVRIWQGTDTISTLKLGAWAIGFKQKRPGRV